MSEFSKGEVSHDEDFNERLLALVDGLAGSGKDVVRISYSDLLGVDRGRDVLTSYLVRLAGEGASFCRAIFHTTPRGGVVPIAGGIDAGLPDVLCKLDLDTVKALPWEEGVVSVIGDIYNLDGELSLEAPRSLLRRVISRLKSSDLTAVVGPELEFFLFHREGKRITRYGELAGNVYSVGFRGDPEGYLIKMLRDLDRFEIGVSAGNHEFASGQFEINLIHSEALDAADRAFRLKSSVKELALREGLEATFMAKPFNDEGGSGFHLHISFVDPTGSNICYDPDDDSGISQTMYRAIAGILRHAPAISALTNPTINSYRRFGPDTLAPWLIDWGLDNRSSMIRVPPERGGATRIEVRLGDASANPYLAIAGVLAGAYLGISGELPLMPALVGYGYDEERSAKLPPSLSAALDALEDDGELIEVLGKGFVDTFVAYKRDEIARFNSHVTDWEFDEYSTQL
ncbi:MAG: glutamine synthetase family protein [Actinomycetota bacterium]|nr:glutamine synthetase family protein [Actinomycetota bacterium]